MTQRGHSYVIVDEVDSILVDEARTPLIISGPTEDLTELYRRVDKLIPGLVEGKAASKADPVGQPGKPGDYELDEKQRQVTLTDSGNEHMVELLRGRDCWKPGSLRYREHLHRPSRQSGAESTHAVPEG